MRVVANVLAYVAASAFAAWILWGRFVQPFLDDRDSETPFGSKRWHRAALGFLALCVTGLILLLILRPS